MSRWATRLLVRLLADCPRGSTPRTGWIGGASGCRAANPCADLRRRRVDGAQATHVRTERFPVATRPRARRGETRHDAHALSGAYAANAVGEADRVAFEAHLTNCGSCRSEVAALQGTAAELTRLVATAPSPALRVRVLAAAARARQLPLAGVRALWSLSKAGAVRRAAGGSAGDAGNRRNCLRRLLGVRRRAPNPPRDR